VTARERAIFVAFTDTVVAPDPVLPPVETTDAARFFESWLDRAPRLNAIALRAALRLLDAATLVSHRRRFHNLPQQDRADYLKRLERSHLRQAAKALKGIAFLCYYGDDHLMKRLGYDADANLARAHKLRAAEGRP
jgi:hypothetical protein